MIAGQEKGRDRSGIRAETGDMTFRGVSLHDKIDPRGQASTWVASQVGRDVDLVAVLGMGRGYHLEALRAMRPEADIFVWEPFPEIARDYLKLFGPGPKAGPGLKGIDIVNSLAEMKSKIGQSLVYGSSTGRCGLLIPEPYKSLAPQEARELKLALRCLELRKSSNLKTVSEFGSLFLSNFLANFDRVLQTAEATAAIDALEGLPAIIVAAGPSLQDSLEEIKEFREQAVIVSVGTVFKRLIKEGIRPDVVVMIEPRDRSAQVSDEPELGSVLLAASSNGHPNHLLPESALNLVFHPQKWQSLLVGDWSQVPDGGNVASAAFTLAVLWGCNPIILTGQDLAYSQGKRYAQGAGSEDPGFDPDGLTGIPGNEEELVFASPEFISYLSWYEESAEFLSRTRPGLELINATKGGAGIGGFSVKKIRDVLGSGPAILPRGGQRITASLAGFVRDPDLIRFRLAQLRREAALIKSLVEDDSLSLTEFRDRVKTSPLGPHLAPLLGLCSDPSVSAQQMRQRLGNHLDQVSHLAAQLQRKARQGLN